MAQERASLYSLCREGSAEDITQYLEVKGNQLINLPDESGYCALHHVFRHRDSEIEEIVDVLVRHSVDVNTRTLCEGDTALHIVVDRYSEDEAVPLTLKLLSHAADPDYRNDKYRTPYDIALSKGMLKVAEYLSSDMTPQDAQEELQNYNKVDYDDLLVKSVISGNQDEIDHCLKNGANPDHINQHGAGSLHYTITHCPLDKLSVLTQLVTAGANVNLQDYEGDTALNLVIKTTQLRSEGTMLILVEKLVEWGSDQTLRDLDDKDAPSLAEERGYTDVLDILANPPADKMEVPDQQRPLSSTNSASQQRPLSSTNSTGSSKPGENNGNQYRENTDKNCDDKNVDNESSGDINNDADGNVDKNNAKSDNVGNGGNSNKNGGKLNENGGNGKNGGHTDSGKSNDGNDDNENIGKGKAGYNNTESAANDMQNV